MSAASRGNGCCDMPLKSLSSHSGPVACEDGGCVPEGPAWLAELAGFLLESAEDAGEEADDGTDDAAMRRVVVWSMRAGGRLLLLLRARREDLAAARDRMRVASMREEEDERDRMMVVAGEPVGARPGWTHVRAHRREQTRERGSRRRWRWSRNFIWRA